MATKRKSESTAEVFAKERETLNRARPSPTGVTTNMVRQPPASPPGVVLVELEGERPGPITSKEIVAPESADIIALTVREAPEDGLIHLESGNGMHLSTARAVPGGTARYRRPPKPPALMTGPQPSDPLKVPQHIPYSGPVKPRYPATVRLVAVPEYKRKPLSPQWRAVVEVTFSK